MGRYYHGDIEGKFWFAVQSSDAPSRFSKSAECEVGYIPYFFDEEHIGEVQAELLSIENKLGENIKKISDFFQTNTSYNDNSLKEIGITPEILEDYADYQLGKKIEQCIISTGQCSFEAEI